MSYRILFDPRAEKELGKLDRRAARRVEQAIHGLEDEPRPQSARPLVGHEHLWRLRVGDYRVIYSIKNQELYILVVRISHRSRAYRGLR
ncbi:MAG TPA: type II toxin-antitoxin system RelE/ParE family toxin [Beutenbergiaceae bacterium]|nr:type II toxin-antitoxin system RelE/ParE family toxin [Beutenbergiaceae bacterium]